MMGRRDAFSEGGDDNVVSAHVAGVENVVIAACEGKATAVSMVEQVQGGAGFDLERGDLGRPRGRPHQGRSQRCRFGKGRDEAD
jgi:hypothetical protein